MKQMLTSKTLRQGGKIATRVGELEKALFQQGSQGRFL